MENLRANPIPQETQEDAPLQLLLFVDDRFKTKEELRRIRATLEKLSGGKGYFLKEVNVAQEPHLTEYYRVIATPTLIRILPAPRQILAGADLAIQIEHWWPSWQEIVTSHLNLQEQMGLTGAVSLHPTPDAIAIQSLRLSDEIFQLKQENSDLQSQIWFKDRMVTILAHDLRNPLTASLLAIDTLSLHFQESDHLFNLPLIQQLLSQARRQLNAIDHLVTDLLESARSSHKRLMINPRKVNLANLCEEVLTKLEDHWKTKNQTVETDIPSDIPWVYVDHERIEQVLMNLLGNAIKYTPTSGRIHLSVLHRTNQKVQVSVCDNGPGIPDDQREQIFEDAFRLERDAEAEGYGIGLALCQKIVQAHYGKIWVDSVLGQGSCFHFTLPTYPYRDGLPPEGGVRGV
jgi:two-component system clock-associated histidine kinase SasA